MTNFSKTVLFIRKLLGARDGRRARTSPCSAEGAPMDLTHEIGLRLLTRCTSVVTRRCSPAQRGQRFPTHYARRHTSVLVFGSKMDGYDETISLFSIGSGDCRYTYIEHSQGSLGASQRSQPKSGVPACVVPFLGLRLHKLQQQSRARRRDPLQSGRSEWPSHDRRPPVTRKSSH